MTRQYDGVRPVVEGTLEGDTWTTTAVNYWEGPTYYSPLAARYLPNGGGGYNYLADALGSTRQLMRNATHAITDTYVYDAFGDTLAATGSTDNPYRYVGGLGYRAGGGGLMQLGVRYYAQELGLFVQRDPEVRQGPHSYGYAQQAPTRRVDADGMMPPFYPPTDGGKVYTIYDAIKEWLSEDKRACGYYRCLSSLGFLAAAAGGIGAASTIAGGGEVAIGAFGLGSFVGVGLGSLPIMIVCARYAGYASGSPPLWPFEY